MKRILQLTTIAIASTSVAVFCSFGQSTNQIENSSLPSSNTINKPFKIITNDKSGCSAIVDQTKTIISLEDKDKKQIWLVNITNELAQIKAPIIGNAEIRDMKFDKEGKNIYVTIGKSTALVIDAKSGLVTFLGSD
jgi:hypothetical protein